mmetsp:Transcript_3270/g.11707  ORF Transcript_3270/g.11707 Transcript_3270/m.11707 type:complete len:259 (+) Transcript_3270:1468-2244(+)
MLLPLFLFLLLLFLLSSSSSFFFNTFPSHSPALVDIARATPLKLFLDPGPLKVFTPMLLLLLFPVFFLLLLIVTTTTFSASIPALTHNTPFLASLLTSSSSPTNPMNGWCSCPPKIKSSLSSPTLRMYSSSSDKVWCVNAIVTSIGSSFFSFLFNRSISSKVANVFSAQFAKCTPCGFFAADSGVVVVHNPSKAIFNPPIVITSNFGVSEINCATPPSNSHSSLSSPSAAFSHVFTSTFVFKHTELSSDNLAPNAAVP